MFGFFSPDANKDEKDANAFASPETIKARRALAQKLMERGTETSPVQHWLQGAARMGQAFQGAVENYYTDKEDKAAYDAAKIDWTGGGMPTPAPQPVALPSVPAPWSSGDGASKSNAVPAHLASMFSSHEDENELPKGYLARTAQIESSFNPSAKNPNSSASGLFQFTSGTASDYDLKNPLDPAASTKAAADLAWDNREALRPVLGRDPTAAELYLAHQQGSGGASKLLANPNARAIDIVGRDAVKLNGGNEGMTAGQFAQLWTNKFDGGKPTEPSAPSAAPQTQLAQAGGINPALFGLAQNALNNPRTSAGDKAIAQGIVQKYLSQEAKDPVDAQLKREQLKAAQRSNSQTKMEIREVNGVTYERPEGSTAPFKPVQSLPEKRDENTSDQKELNQINNERLKAGLPELRLDEWKLQKGKASAPAVNIDQKQESEFGKETGKSLAKRFDTLATEGDEAWQTYQHLGELRRLGKNIDFGASASIRATLGNLGIKTEGISDIEAYNTLINRLTPQQRLPGSGATSDFDAKMFRESLPRLMNTPNGNSMIMDTLEKVSQNRMARGDIAMRVQMGELTPKQAMGEIRKLQEEAKALSDQFREPAKSSGQAASNAPIVGTVKGGYRFKGGNPADQNSWEQVR